MRGEIFTPMCAMSRDNKFIIPTAIVCSRLLIESFAWRKKKKSIRRGLRKFVSVNRECDFQKITRNARIFLKEKFHGSSTRHRVTNRRDYLR